MSNAMADAANNEKDNNLVNMSGVDLRTAYYYENYDIIANYSCITQNGGKKEYVDKGAERPYVCRFCGKREPEVKFSDDTHAISELIGNKTLLIKSECDNCNKRFGRDYEDDLAKYLDPVRTLSQTRGKRGIPSFMTTDEVFRMDETADGVVIQLNEGCKYVDTVNGEIHINIPKKTYTPLAVFKALVFMALSIIPENELSNFIDTINWLNEDIYSNSNYDMNVYSSHVIECFVEGIKPLPLNAIVLRRKPGKEVPYAFFVIEFDNTAFQINIPCIREDALLGDKTIQIHLFPLPVEPIADLQSGIKDLSSVDPVKGEIASFTIHYDDKESITDKYSSLQDVLAYFRVKPLNKKKDG